MHECIYEAQISVMVTGLDEWFWTGYCFVDAYYHKDGVGESAEIFADEFGGLPKKMEPISGGKWELDIPVWDPREYFLRILLCRTEQVSQEWKNAVYRLLQETKSYVGIHIFHYIQNLTTPFIFQNSIESFIHNGIQHELP